MRVAVIRMFVLSSSAAGCGMCGIVTVPIIRNRNTGSSISAEAVAALSRVDGVQPGTGAFGGSIWLVEWDGAGPCDRMSGLKSLPGLPKGGAKEADIRISAGKKIQHTLTEPIRQLVHQAVTCTGDLDQL